MIPSWIRHVDFHPESYCRTGALDDNERFFLENQDRATTLLEFQPNLSYEYDDYALCELDGRFYIFHTCGCSCPSPSETWGLDISGSKEEVLSYLKPDNSSYSHWNDFLRQISALDGWDIPNIPEAGRSDW